MVDRDALQQALSDRYVIDRELGRGGFAVVFLARDIRHDRPVAIKVLHAEIAESLGAERFEREIRLAARLQHPHILGVFDSGSAAGRLWFAMPFVEGETLRQRLDREHQLPINDAVAIAREVADALDYAHEHDVIHRDIKPENILLTGRHAMIADFGIARALSNESGLTQTGLVVGTASYMSPEQASGEREIDGRTDVYSLGSVLYEMLAGTKPFNGASSQAIIARMLSLPPESLRVSRETVNPVLDGVIMRALAKAPADRFATAAAFRDALDMSSTSSAVPAAPPVVAQQTTKRSIPRLWIGLAAAVTLAVVGGVLWRARTTGGAGQSLAVLPFENMGGGEDAYFADGITEEVRGKLSAIPGLRVIARTSAGQYRGSHKTPHEIGGELGVQYLLTGTVRWAKRTDGQRTVRVTPELVQVSTGSTKWQEPFDVVMADIFATQTTIATEVAQRLNLQLSTTVQQKLGNRPTENVAAYDEYLRGEQATESLGNLDPKAEEAGLVHYLRAVELDSGFVLARGRVSLIKTYQFSDYPSEQTRAAATEALGNLQRIAPGSSVAHRAAAIYQRTVMKEYRAAYDEIHAAVAADPENAELLSSLAGAESTFGMFDSALVHIQHAKSLDPRSTSVLVSLASTLSYVRRFPEAIATLDQIIAISPANLDAVQAKVRDQVLIGDMPGAKATVHAVLEHVDSTTLAVRFAYYQEMMWILDEPLLRRIVTLKPVDFYKDQAMGAMKIGRTWLLLGDTARGRVWGDSALRLVTPRANANPDDAQLAEVMGRDNALAGHNEAAVADARRSLALRETNVDARNGPYFKFQAARILIQAGDYEHALDLIEPLLTMPAGMLTPGWMKLDPNFAPLRSLPRFQRLIGAA